MFFVIFLIASILSLGARDARAKPEEFDSVKFLVTVVVGAISGYLAYALGWTQEVIAAWFATTGIIVWIEFGLKTFVRRLSTT